MSEAQNVHVKRDEALFEVEVSGDIPAEALAKYRNDALKEIQKSAKLDGFRPGKAPLERIEQVYGEAAIMREAAQRAIEKELPEILAAQNILIVEAPRVSTESPAAGKPLHFTARASLPPEVKLPDYRAIAKKFPASKEPVIISDEEYGQATLHLRRERARIDKIEQGVEPKNAAEEVGKLEEKDLPALDDAFAKSIGYDSAEKFTTELRENMKNEKTTQQAQLRRNQIIDELVKEARISYPALMREYELDDMEARLAQDLSRFGASLEQYLKEQKKTREEMRGMWKDAADKRAKVRLILSEIARAEKISPDEKAVEQELAHAKEHYKDLSDDQLRAGIAHALRNDAVLQFLETL